MLFNNKNYRIIICIFLIIFTLLLLIKNDKEHFQNLNNNNRKKKYFNIDLHISVIEDINNINEKLGNKIIINDNSLSDHCFILNKKRCNDYIINARNWKSIVNSEDKLNDFYKKHKKELEDYDGFIITHTPSFFLLYEKFNKPIIIVNSCRYENPFMNNLNKWKLLNNMET